MNTESKSLVNDPVKLNRLLKVLAGVAIVVGLGLGLIALTASLGVWLGFWDFRQGFDMLRFVNSHAMWVTFMALGITFLLVAARRLPAAHNAGTLASLTLVATLAAALAWLVPESYRPGEGIPPIHDITTDTANPPQFVDVLPLRGPGTNPVEYGTSQNMTPERQAELQANAYPDIQPVIINAPESEVFQRALDAVESLGWELVAQVPEEGRIEATDTTFWFRFKDDVVIRIRAEEEGTRVDARSTSRVGVSDVGKNAERLRAFFDTL